MEENIVIITGMSKSPFTMVGLPDIDIAETIKELVECAVGDIKVGRIDKRVVSVSFTHSDFDKVVTVSILPGLYMPNL